MEETIVRNGEETDGGLLVDVELPRRAHRCPDCGRWTDRVHDYRLQRVKDSNAFGKPVVLRLRKRRYVCAACGKRFYEQNRFLPRYYRRTQREIVATIQDFRELVSATHIVREHGVSTSTAQRYFSLVSFGRCKLPRVLSLDEFKGDAGGERFQTIVTDLRRIGKSYLLFTLYCQYLLDSGVEEDQIVGLALGEIDNARYRNPFELNKIVKERIADKNKRYYVFIDEIQFVTENRNPYVGALNEKLNFIDVVLGLMKIQMQYAQKMTVFMRNFIDRLCRFLYYEMDKMSNARAEILPHVFRPAAMQGGFF